MRAGPRRKSAMLGGASTRFTLHAHRFWTLARNTQFAGHPCNGYPVRGESV